ncbi:MAG: branched-chain amino acid ABC transporter permease [Solirubrobacterales bacterium]
MTDVVQVLYSGLLLAAIYAALGMGLALIWNALNFLNMTHGALFTVGGYAAWTVLDVTHGPPLLGLLTACVAAAVVGGAAYLVVFRRLLERPDAEITTIVAGLGIAIMLEAAVLLIFGPRQKALPELASGTIDLPGGVTGQVNDVIVMCTSIAALIAMAVFLARTRYGLAIRALSQERVGARLMGVNTSVAFLMVMMMGSALAGLSGSLLANVTFLSPTGGFEALLKGLIITIVGGLGSLRGTVVAALAVGMIQTAASFYLGGRWALPVLFGAIFVLLILRPSGFAGRLTVETGGSR